MFTFAPILSAYNSPQTALKKSAEIANTGQVPYINPTKNGGSMMHVVVDLEEAKCQKFTKISLEGRSQKCRGGLKGVKVQFQDYFKAP